jgi:Flp pilus assembly protein TadG
MMTKHHSIARPGGLLQRLARDQSGNVGMIFGGCAITLVAFIGGAVDYGRWLNARSQTQYALDAATLVAGRQLQLTGDATKAKAAADAYYNQMKSHLTINDTVNFVALNNNTVVQAHGGAYVATPFLSIIGVNRLAVVADAATPTTVCIGPSCPSADGTGSTGNSGTSIEISMMLDTTGSMCDIKGGQYQQPCTSAVKLDALKVAAKELVDIVVWDDQSEYTSKVGIAPFSDSINVGDKYFHAVTGLGRDNGLAEVPDGTYTYPSTCYTTITTTTVSKGKTKTTTTTTLNASCKNNAAYANYERVAPCVIERIGANEFTGVAPSGSGSSTTNTTLIPQWKFNPSPGTKVSSVIACDEATAIQPLTADKSVLKSTINGLVASNGTAGQLGTGWSWYLLAPEWGAVFKGEHAPRPYSELTELGETRQPKLRKIAVLMTDGAYNTYQGTGYADSDSRAIAVQTRAKQVCQAMKDKGIVVYTIGFQLGSDAHAIDTLTQCSSTHTIDSGATIHNFYKADSPDALQSAFRDIALQISKLRLSH